MRNPIDEMIYWGQQHREGVYMTGPTSLEMLGRKFNTAHAASKADGRLRYVFLGGTGWIVTLRRRPMLDCYWTNGAEGGSWSAGAKEGKRIQELTP
jgi:hypothetical protein